MTPPSADIEARTPCALARQARAQRAIEKRLLLHADYAALAIVVVGFAILVAEAGNRYFTPDEALHVEVNVPSFVDVYRRSLWNAHPPLFFLLLHSWLWLGRSEVFLRLLPAIFGGGFLWFTYRWAGRLFGKTAGLMTLLVVALSPACLPLSAEVRGYSLLLFLSVAALVEFEIAVEKRSVLRMSLFSLLLYLAILTHYSALFIVMSLGVYALFRLRRSGASRRLFALWAASQIGVGILYLLLYLSHLAILRGSGMEQGAMAIWLRTGYFQSGREGPFSFVSRQTGAIFQYFFGSHPVATVAILLTVTGFGLLGFKRQPSAVLLFMPLVLGASAGLLDCYPFSETRHSIYLVPFVAAAIGVALTAITGGRGWAILLVAVGITFLFWRTPVWGAPPRSLSRMNAAVDRVRVLVEPGIPIFADSRTAALLDYYLSRRAFSTRRVGRDWFWESSPDHYCIVASPLWDPDAKTFVDEFERMIRVYRLSVGQRLWVVRLGPEYDPAGALSLRLPTSIFPTRLKFGDLSIVEVWLDDVSEEGRGQRQAAIRAVAGAGQQSAELDYGQ